MNFKTRNSNITKVLYIVLALCVISIAFLSIYSMLKQNQTQADNGGSVNENLKNEPVTEAILDNGGNNNNNLYQNNEGNQGAVSDILKEKGAQPQTQPPTQKPTASPKPKPTEAPTAPSSSMSSAAQSTTDRTADLIVEPSEAIEVISVPTIYIKPVPGSISKSHNPDVPEYSVIMNDYRTHIGIDVDSSIGANVKAISDGVISAIYDDPLMGKTIIIDHPGNLQSIYMNLQEALPQNTVVGASVKGGDIIAGVGETALIEITDVPHLHFELKKDGEFVNPLDYITY